MNLAYDLASEINTTHGSPDQELLDELQVCLHLSNFELLVNFVLKVIKFNMDCLIGKIYLMFMLFVIYS